MSNETLEALCARFNEENPVGTLIVFEDFIGRGETHRGEVIQAAAVIDGHSAVVKLEGWAGYVDVQHCKRPA